MSITNILKELKDKIVKQSQMYVCLFCVDLPYYDKKYPFHFDSSDKLTKHIDTKHNISELEHFDKIKETHVK